MSQVVPSKTKYSYACYVCFPNDGNRHEIVDGDHYMNPAPSPKHQTVSRLLQYQLMTQIEMKGRGMVFNAPTDVELAPHDIVQPELVVVMNDRKKIIGAKKLKGVPTLVIEILSDLNPEYDKVLKAAAYERVRIPEYWIVDPEEMTIHQFLLTDGKYVLHGVQHSTIQAVVIDDVIIELNLVWA
jgi:Uma2 family endonuclease